MDAPQWSLTPEPRSRDPRAGRAGSGRGGSACLGGTRVWQMARDAVARGLGATRPEEKAFRAHQYGAIVRWPVTSSGSSVHGSRTVRPSTTRPQQGRRYLPFRWASRRASDGRHAASGSPLSPRTGRVDRYERNRLTDTPAPASQRAAGR